MPSRLLAALLVVSFVVAGASEAPGEGNETLLWSLVKASLHPPRPHLSIPLSGDEKRAYSFPGNPTPEKEIHLSFFAAPPSYSQEQASGTNSSEEPVLKISGRKVIGIKHTLFRYLDEEWAKSHPEKSTSSTDIDQKLQVRVTGMVGDRSLVEVEYDDTRPRSEQQSIHLTYKGKEEEVLQEAELGDVRLGFPETSIFPYDKELFGVKATAKLGRLHLTGIGSLTKGVSETRTFTGRSTFETRHIYDTSYLKMRYYRIYFDPSDLPLDIASAEVFIDDQDGTNNQASVEMTVQGENGDSYSGWFDYQYPVEDYLLDYTLGVINFKRGIEDNFVIALSYRDTSSHRHPAEGYRMIKKKQDSLYDSYYLKNRYYLGSRRIQDDDFILRILDLSGQVLFDLSFSEDYPEYEVEVDYDEGILRILRPSEVDPEEPFPQAYPPLLLHRYTIYTEYHHGIDAFFLSPDIIPGSEKIYMDGQLLTRDVDYLLDYSSGFLSFIDPGRITPDTAIKVDYEWMPFMGRAAPILGVRGEYFFQEGVSLGSTFVSHASPRTRKVPQLGSAPSSLKAGGVDLNFSFPWGRGEVDASSPYEVSLSGEVASSRLNPNTFGKAMIENFELTKTTDELAKDEEMWQYSSPPPEALGPRGEILISSEDVPGEEINTEWSRDEREVLVLDYSLDTSQPWDSVVYSISSQGKDYTQMHFLELWLKGDGKNLTVHLDVGVVSEDVDGDGPPLKTEDVNGDGKLNPGEDIGIWIRGKLVGEGNGRLDSEDLDGNFVLDTEENISTYNFAIEADWTDWRRVTLPLNTSANWETVERVVKHLRLWIEGSGVEGTLKFAGLDFFGDRWEEENLLALPINTHDDPEYDPFSDSDFLAYYEEMYGEAETYQEKWRKEGAFSLEYNLTSGEEGWVQQTFIQPQDYSSYGSLNFWAYREAGDGEAIFYLRFGSDVKEGENYYEISRLADWDQRKWHHIRVSFDELSRVGTPSLREVKQLRAGFRNPSQNSIQGRMYLNDIFLSEVKMREGLSRRVGLTANLGESFSVDGQYKEMDAAFQALGANSLDRSSKQGEMGATLTLFDHLPLSYRWNREESETISDGETDVPSWEEGRVIRESESYQLRVLFPSWPEVALSRKNEVADYLTQGKKKSWDIYDASLNYRLPFRHSLLPTSIRGSYQVGEVQTLDLRLVKEDIEKWKISLPFKPLENFNLNSTYSETRAKERREGEGPSPKSRGKELLLDSSATFFHLSPRMSFRGGYKESNFRGVSPERRDISTYSEISLSMPLRIGSFFPGLKILETLSFYPRYEQKKETWYENTTASLDYCSKIGLKDPQILDGEIKRGLDKKHFTLRESWRPLSFLELGSEYGYIEEGRIYRAVPYFIRMKRWPVLRATLDLNKASFPLARFTQRISTSSLVMVSYAEKVTTKQDISSKTTREPSLVWRTRLKRPEDLGLTLTYRFTENEEHYFIQPRKTKDTVSHYQLKLDHYALPLWAKKIPLLGRWIDPEKKAHVSTSLSLDEKKKHLASGLVGENNTKWKLNADTEYTLSQAVKLGLGVETGYFQDRVRVGEDYFSLGASLRVELRF